MHLNMCPQFLIINCAILDKPYLSVTIKLLAKRYLDLCVSEGVREAANQSHNWDLLNELICLDVHAELLVLGSVGLLRVAAGSALAVYQLVRPASMLELAVHNIFLCWRITVLSVIVPGCP